MMVWPFLIILTVIWPGERGIWSLFTPGVTVKVADELPHCSITVAWEVAKATAHMLSSAQLYPDGRGRGSLVAVALAGFGLAQ